MNIFIHYLAASLLLLSLNLSAQQISLSELESKAVNSDPAQKIYQAQQNALIAQGKSSATLADPMIKFGVANIPTDSFKLDQDPMTQISVGLSQQFSRGSQLKLQQQGFNLQSEVNVFQALDRKLLVRKAVRELWFNILFVEKSKQLVENNRVLFRGFYRDLQSQFSLGLVENEDLLLAEIELGKFADKLASLTQQSLTYRSLLSEWVGEIAYAQLDKSSPLWPESFAYIEKSNSLNNSHYELLTDHPKVQALTQNIKVAQSNIHLAEQAYQPSFKVELGYGHRLSEMDNGDRRSDLLSGFVSMDIPLFTDQRQDQSMIAAQQFKGQKQADQRLLLRQLNALLNAEIVNYLQLKERQTRYQESLLKQAKVYTELLEQSYQSNTRSFKEVIQAYIYEQNLTLEYQQLYFDGLKSLSKIRYFQAL